ncbi:MAG: hypothetical protein GMKNLPBB_02266 [Myxococcota bacterium]|nr:hypothetical protein [Myxococcota bacterium]
MSIDVAPEIVIARPRAEVAAVMFDPSRDREWTRNVVASRALTPGRLRAGSQVERTVRFLGRRFSYLYEVIAAEEDVFVEMLVNEPFPMKVRYELSDAPEGTRARIRAAGDATGFFRLAGPLMAPMVRKSIEADLADLKKLVESSAAK